MRFSNQGWSIGDPVEVETLTIRNIRGDVRREWTPATIASVFPHITVVFADSSWLNVQDPQSTLRTPAWKRAA